MNLIPKPQKYEKKDKFCRLDNLIYFYIDEEIIYCKDVIYSILKKGLKRDLEFKKGKIDIIFDNNVKKDGYILDIEEDYIKIFASTTYGALYAVQTIRVLGEFDLEDPALYCCHIEDYPDFEWRGLLLDEARYFFGKKAVLRLIDMMSLHKLNVLHWHLSDDNGWRLEIKKYPKLVEVGSKREATQINGWKTTKKDNKPHSGYYTQDEIKEIIKYAKLRGIMIVPEIDMPAHFAAGLAAYKELACRPLDRKVPWYMGGYYPNTHGMLDWNRPICVSNKNTIEFVHNLLDEVFDLFEAPYFHVGGDEADMREWKKCPTCQNKMKEMGYKDVSMLQCSFINEIQKYASKKGKRLIGWNECLKGNALDNSVIVQYWTKKKDDKVLEHIKNGGEVILSKHQSFYFDMPYAQYQLSNTYNFDMSSLSINEKYIDRVKGLEGALWTEWIKDIDIMDFRLYPRIEALSEIAWNRNAKNYFEFKTRLEKFKPILKKYNINYAENKICDEMSPIRRLYTQFMWYHGNQNIETDLNFKIKNKEK